MKRFHHYLVMLCLFVFLSSDPSLAGNFETTFRTQVSEFLNSLDKAQSTSCLQPLAGKQRWRMQYTGGNRPGIQIKQLNAQQRTNLEKTLRIVLSPYGWKMANAVAKQDAKKGDDPLGKYWITCFGDPRKGDFAFRLAEHHLTIVHLEVEKGETKEFGPILLGANPPKLWKADEEALLAAWKHINDKKVLIKGKKAVASKPMPGGEGVLFTELNTQAQTALKAAWQLRLNVFSEQLRVRINKLHTSRGGWEKSRVAFYNEVPTKRSVDGGRWDFKCGLPGMVWDYQSSSGHIHMSLWAKSDKKDKVTP